MNDDELRMMTEKNIKKILNDVSNNYMKVFDEYCAEGSRESAFLKDLTDSILPISEVLEVYVRGKYINPEYAVRKLIFAKDIIDNAIEHFNQIAIFGTKNEREK